jgi:Predicted membrane protein
LKAERCTQLLDLCLETQKAKTSLFFRCLPYLFATASTFFRHVRGGFGFIPIFVGLAIAMGYDAIVGMSVVALGCGLGFAAAFMNPFTVGLAQKLSELPLFSGLGFRVVAWFVFVTMGVMWMMRYAAKIRHDPSKSLMAGIDMGAMALDHDELVNTKFTGRNRAVLLVLFIGMSILIWGVLKKGWYFDELCGILLITGIAAGVSQWLWPEQDRCDIYRCVEGHSLWSVCCRYFAWRTYRNEAGTDHRLRHSRPRPAPFIYA